MFFVPSFCASGDGAASVRQELFRVEELGLQPANNDFVLANAWPVAVSRTHLPRFWIKQRCVANVLPSGRRRRSMWTPGPIRGTVWRNGGGKPSSQHFPFNFCNVYYICFETDWAKTAEVDFYQSRVLSERKELGRQDRGETHVSAVKTALISSQRGGRSSQAPVEGW